MERRLATRVTRDFKSLRNLPWLCRNAAFLSILVFFSSFAFGQEVPRRMALVVGVSDYFHKNMEDLKFAEKDAKDVGLQLQRLGFEVTEVTGREATKTKVEAEISSFLGKASQLDSDSIVFIICIGLIMTSDTCKFGVIGRIGMAINTIIPFSIMSTTIYGEILSVVIIGSW